MASAGPAAAAGAAPPDRLGRRHGLIEHGHTRRAGDAAGLLHRLGRQVAVDDQQPRRLYEPRLPLQRRAAHLLLQQLHVRHAGGHLPGAVKDDGHRWRGPASADHDARGVDAVLSARGQQRAARRVVRHGADDGGQLARLRERRHRLSDVAPHATGHLLHLRARAEVAPGVGWLLARAVAGRHWGPLGPRAGVALGWPTLPGTEPPRCSSKPSDCACTSSTSPPTMTARRLPRSRIRAGGGAGGCAGNCCAVCDRAGEEVGLIVGLRGRARCRVWLGEHACTARALWGLRIPSLINVACLRSWPRRASARARA
jgi:hypothetical protein